MTDIWKLPNGNYLRAVPPELDQFLFAEIDPNGGVVTVCDNLPAGAVPMVPGLLADGGDKA